MQIDTYTEKMTEVQTGIFCLVGAMATQNGEAEAKRFYKTVDRKKIQIEKRIKELGNII